MSQVIADAIADQILEQNLPAGARLANEAQMVEQYGAGRSSVREALRLLEADGLVDIRPGLGGGAVVGQPDVNRVARRLTILLRLSGASFSEVVAARKTIEPSLARHAAEAATDEQVAEITASVERLAALSQSNEAFIEENARFHSLIADASGNAVLTTFWRAISAIVDGHEVGVRYDERARSAVVAAHRAVAEAVAAREPALAAEAMSAHVSAVDKYLEKHYPDLVDKPIRIIAPS